MYRQSLTVAGIDQKPRDRLIGRTQRGQHLPPQGARTDNHDPHKRLSLRRFPGVVNEALTHFLYDRPVT